MPRPDAPLAGVAATLAALAEAAPDQEVCGLVVSGPGEAAVAWPLPNRADDPSRSFTLGPADLLGALRRLDEEGRDLLAVYHSHPAGGPGLSARDLEGALADGEPLLRGAAQIVVALDGGRAVTVRAHRWGAGRFEGVDLWTSVR
jgi:proteasome lid subunit RPN8/RPN11